MKRRIGIFGGTYDPVHLGHLYVAEQCRERAKLDEVHFLVSARPPHKDGEGVHGFDDRVAMLRLALAGNTAFRIDLREKDRPGPSYTVDTLRQIRAEQPETDVHFIMGADGVIDFPGWREPAEILKLATLCVVARPGYAAPDFDWLAGKLGVADSDIRRVEIPMLQIDFASREIRARIEEGLSVRYMLPDAVIEYIREKKLYQPNMSNRFQGSSRSN